jgi:hypothetical protein
VDAGILIVEIRGFFTNYLIKGTSARNSDQKNPGIGEKNVRIVYGSFTGFTRFSMCTARAIVA